MTKGIFVTAVGTDVGKTYVSALLCKELKERGCAVNYWKPALSGASIPPRDDVFVKDRAVLNDENITVSYVFCRRGVAPFGGGAFRRDHDFGKKCGRIWKLSKTAVILWWQRDAAALSAHSASAENP